MKNHILLALIILLCGCSQPFSEYYHDKTAEQGLSKFIIDDNIQPEVRQGTSDPEADTVKMLEDNYGLLGYSAFFAPKLDDSQAIEQAKKVKASVVLLYSKHKDTSTGVQPIYLNKGGVIYTSSQADGYNQTASYWVKNKPPVLGIGVKELTPEQRKQSGSNNGMCIAYVIKQSPAFKAQIINGDILINIDNKEINDNQSFKSAQDSKAGKTITILLIRDGKKIVKKVKLNPEP
jgi:serine protease Do